MACANQNFELVKLLVSHKASVIAPHAAGRFFFSNPAICLPSRKSNRQFPELVGRGLRHGGLLVLIVSVFLGGVRQVGISLTVSLALPRCAADNGGSVLGVAAVD